MNFKARSYSREGAQNIRKKYKEDQYLASTRTEIESNDRNSLINNESFQTDRLKKNKRKKKAKSRKRPLSLLSNNLNGYLPMLKDPFKKTLVLDMDETLIHTEEKKLFKYEQIVYQKEKRSKTKHYMSIRPGVSEFLSRMSKLYEIVIFTASVRSYALAMIDAFDADSRISHVLTRKNCSFKKGHYYKDISKLGRPLKDIIIVDNSPIVYNLHRQNGLPIKSWMGEDKSDEELNKLSRVLQKLATKYDVREFIRGIISYSEENMSQYSPNGD